MSGEACICFFFSSRRRHTRYWCDWSSDVCSSDLLAVGGGPGADVLEDVVVQLQGVDPAVARVLLGGALQALDQVMAEHRSEERRVGKECRSRWSPYH